MERRYIESFFFLALLIGTLTVVVVMFLPFANTLILAAILAFLFSAPFEQLVQKFRGNRTLAALVMTLLILVTILVPLALAGWRIATEAAGLYSSIREHTDTGTLVDGAYRVEAFIQRFIPSFQLDPIDLNAQAQRVASGLVGLAGVAFVGASRLVVGFLLLLLFFFFLIRDGGRLKHRIMELSPMADSQDEAIIARIGRAIAATVRGKILLGVIQGLVAGLGMALFGVPNPALWGAVTMLASFIPSIGTGLVLIPAAIYLFATGHPGAAVGMAIWAVAVVGLLDNVLGPKLMASGTRIHPLVMMLAVLGGIGLFGAMGILLGPIIVSLLYALLDIYVTLIRRPEEQ